MDTIDFLLDENDVMAPQPSTFLVPLKHHQLVSLYRMMILDRDCGFILKKNVGLNVKSNIGILGDYPGHGKSATMLALIESNKEMTCNSENFFPVAKLHTREGFGIITIEDRELDDQIYIPTSLLVVPDNLIDHWRTQIEKFTNLTYETVDRDFKDILIEEYDIILCSASHYNIFVSFNYDFIWNRVIFDEADSIHIPNTQYVSTRFLWLITSTFENISRRRNNGFLKRLFANQGSDVMEFYHPVVVKCKDEFVKKSFDLEEPLVTIVECLTSKIIDAMHYFINPKVLEMINANDINNAVLALGGNVDTDNNIITLVTRTVRNDITKLKYKIEGINNLEIAEEEKNKKRKELKDKLKNLEERETNIIQNIKEASTNECPICYNNLVKPTVVPCCSTIFCGECLLTWLSNNIGCPLCRSHVDLTNLNIIEDKKIVSEKSNILSKLDTCIKIILDRPNGKFIVFSSHNETFVNVERKLTELKIPFGTLTTALRTEKTISKFKAGVLQVILLNSTYNGAGLDLHEASDVILFHEMNKGLELQTITRAQRPGRDIRLNVWKLGHVYEYKNKV